MPPNIVLTRPRLFPRISLACTCIVLHHPLAFHTIPSRHPENIWLPSVGREKHKQCHSVGTDTVLSKTRLWTIHLGGGFCTLGWLWMMKRKRDVSSRFGLMFQFLVGKYLKNQKLRWHRHSDCFCFTLLVNWNNDIKCKIRYYRKLPQT